MFDRLKPLTALPFLICLFLLLLNDHYLKGAFHNTLTGKLSDFCGLFIFPIFWSVFVPKRKIEVFFLTGLFFIYWKSEYSSPFIELFSTYFFPIQRVVDLTDLIALIMLPLAYYSLKVPTFNIRFQPSFIAVLAFFAFCASTFAEAQLDFEQPQYLLYKSDVLPDSNYYDGDFEFHRFDSLMVVEVKGLISDRRPVRRDDFDKNIVVNGLYGEILEQMPVMDSIMPPNKITLLRIETPEYEDSLRFRGGRLDGPFIRKKGNLVSIEGFYKNGIEDSTWTYRENTSPVITKKIFIKGEKTEIQKFKNGRMIDTDEISTRTDVIIRKYVQLTLLLVLIGWMVFLLRKNYLLTYPEVLQMGSGWKLLLCLSLPISVWIVQIGISQFIADAYSAPLGLVSNFIVIYILSPPLFMISVFLIKWRKTTDILWTILLLALAYTFMWEYMMLNALSRTV